jgi:hypothetical protein
VQTTETSIEVEVQRPRVASTRRARDGDVGEDVQMYEPQFASIPSSPDAWWERIRDVVRGWRGAIEPVPDDSTQIQSLETEFGAALPALRSWLAFHSDLAAANLFQATMRDDFDCSWDPAFDCFVVLLQSERDRFWAIESSVATAEDPPVVSYHLTEDERGVPEGAWSSPEASAPTLTGFVLRRVLRYVHASGGGFGTWLPTSKTYLAEVSTITETDASVGALRILEGPDLITWLEPGRSVTGEDGVLLRVELGSSWRGRVPDFLMDLGTATGHRHGAFVPGH